MKPEMRNSLVAFFEEQIKEVEFKLARAEELREARAAAMEIAKAEHEESEMRCASLERQLEAARVALSKSKEK